MPFDGTESPISARALMLVLDMERLIEKGWHKGDWAYHGRYCLIGALNKAQGRRPGSIRSDHPALHDPVGALVLSEIKSAAQMDACEFNDDYNTRKTDVLAVLGQVKSRLVETVDAI